MNIKDQIYTCPMHPEIVSDKPGSCPKCHMALVLKTAKPKVHQVEDKGLGEITWRSYLPLINVISVIILVVVALSLRDMNIGVASLHKTISYFMSGFFLTFATFKLMDLKGFAEGYSTYDLLAKKLPIYGYIYPFIELAFGLSMILAPTSVVILCTEIFVMMFSGIGVAIQMAKREPFMCACLGTFLKVPLTYVTLVEDFGMMALGMIMLIIK
jgi:hypothetical protein